MALPIGSVYLGSAYGQILIDMSQVEQQMQGAFQQVERQAGNAFRRFGGTVQRAGDSIAGLGGQLMLLTAPIAAIGAIGLKSFGDFDAIMAEIAARTGATAEQMDAVQAKAIEMGQETASSATQAGDAMLQLLASGFGLEQTFAALPAVLDAAAAGGLDLGYTADVVTDALAMWGLEAEDARQVSDALARGASASSAEIGDLAQGLGNVGPIAASFGISLDDTVAILAAFSERGIKGAEAGTQLRSMLTNMTRDTEDVTGLWDELGISMFDATGKMRPLDQVLGELRVALAGMTDEERIHVIKTLGGAYGQMGLDILTSSDALSDMTALMNEQADAATVAEARLNSLPGVVGQLRSSFETLLITGLGPSIEEGLKPLIRQVTQFLNQATEWVKANPEITATLVKVGAALVALGPVMLVAGKAVAALGAAFALLTSPIGIVIALAAALTAAYVTNFMGFRDAVDSFKKWFIKTAMPAIIDFIEDELIPTFEDFKRGVKAVWEDAQPHLESLHDWFVETAGPAIKNFILDEAIPALKDLIDWLKRTWDDVQPALSALFSWFISTAMPAIVGFVTGTVIPTVEDLIEILKDAWEDVQPALSSLYDWFVTTALPAIVLAIGTFMNQVVTPLITALKNIWDQAGPKLQEFYDYAVNTLSKLKEKVFDPIKDAINDVIGVINDMVGALSSIADAVPSFLIPGSPTPFELGLRGIKSAMDSLASSNLSMGLAQAATIPMPGATPAMAPAAVGVGAGNMSVNAQFTVNIPAGMTTEQGGQVGAEIASNFKRELQEWQRWHGHGVRRR